MIKERELLDRYEEWDPDTQSVTEWVADLGISRQRLYTVLAKHGVTPKTKRGGENVSRTRELEDQVKHLQEEVSFLRNLVETLAARLPVDAASLR